jgi:haloalkane dehalogenase
LIVPDHLGCGLSDKPRQTYRLADRIDHLGQLVQQLELQNITLLAHDWGGAIGLGLATEMPERFSRFALLNTAAFRSGWMPKRIRVCRAPVLGKIAVQGLNGFARSALWMAMHDPRRLSREAREGLLAPYDSWRNRRAIYDFVQDIPLSDKHPSYATLERIETRLPLLKDKPWMFVWGMRDWCFKPQFLERFLDFVPRAEVHRLEDAGHYVLEDAPDEVIAHVSNFLQQHPQ